MIIRISERRDFPAEWTTRRDDIVMRNPRIGVVQHVVTCGRTGASKYDQPLLVTHAGVVCVARDDQHNLALLKRYREVCVPGGIPRAVPLADGTACGDCSYEFPRGGCEHGESTEQAARRETEEEVGLIATHAVWLDRVNPDTAFFPYSHDVFLIDIDRRRPSSTPRDPNEEIEVEFVRLAELLRRIARGEIYCGLTKAALATYVAGLSTQGELMAALQG